MFIFIHFFFCVENISLQRGVAKNKFSNVSLYNRQHKHFSCIYYYIFLFFCCSSPSLYYHTYSVYKRKTQFSCLNSDFLPYWTVFDKYLSTINAELSLTHFNRAYYWVWSFIYFHTLVIQIQHVSCRYIMKYSFKLKMLKTSFVSWQMFHFIIRI